MNNNFKYYENDFELAVLDIFSNCGWEYECGYDMHRSSNDIILPDFKKYLNNRYGDFSDNEIEEIKRNLLNVSSQSLYKSI